MYTMDSSQGNTTPVEEREPSPTNAVDEAKVDLTVPDGNAIDTTTPTTPTTGSAPSQVPITATATDSWYTSLWKRFVTFYWDNEFLILVVLSICLAKAYPPLGADYLAKEITASWIAVIIIFVLCGLGLKTEEFANAFKQLKFNIALQIFNFGVVSSIVFGVSRALIRTNVISEGLGNGMVIGSCVPLTINMVIVLVRSSGGDEATAIFNSAFANMIGVFLSPLLILGYLGVSASIDLGQVFMQVALRVILPVVVGQILQKFSPAVVAFAKKYKKYISATQQYLLIFIVYTVFCETFSNANNASSVGDIFIMIAVQICLMGGLLVLSWYFFGFIVPNSPKLRATALHASVHKTVAMGIPLISAIYGDDPLVGLYTLPLLIWHSLQLVVGSTLAPKLAVWVKQEQDRLGQPDADSEVSEDEESNHSISPENQVRITDDIDNTDTNVEPSTVATDKEK